jgi:hypothetical protein
MTLARFTFRQDYLWAVLVGISVGALCLISPMIALALIAGSAFLVIALRKPILLCYTVVAAIVFLSGMPRGQLIGLFIPNEPILLGTAGLAYFAIIARRRKVEYPRVFLLALLIFVIGTAVAPVIAYYARDYALRMADIFSLIAPVQYMVLVWMFSQIPQNDSERARILHWMLLCASVVSFIGLLQAVDFGPVVNLITRYYPSLHEAQAEDLGRVTSVLGAWNSLGNYLMIALLIIMSTYRYKHSVLGYANILLAIAMCGACLLASGSFASIFGLALGIVIIKGVFDRKDFKILLIMGVGFAIGALLLQGNIAERLNYQFRNGGIVPETLAYRFVVWEQIYFPIIGRNLAWGVSPTFGSFLTWHWAESQYLYLLFRSGLVSLIAHVSFVSLLLYWLHKRIRGSEGLSRMLAVTVFAILVALSIMGFTNEVFTSSGAIDYLWILVGLTAGSVLKPTPQLSAERR